MRLKNFARKIKLRTWIALATFVVLIPLVIIGLYHPSDSKAEWYSDAWAYRQPWSFTHNAALSDRRVGFTISNTNTLVTAGKLLSSCNDIRFTDNAGRILRIQLTGSCNAGSTTYDVIIPTVINGLNSGYVYYGNPGAGTVSEDVSAFGSTSPSGGAPAFSTEEKGSAPILYWPMNEARNDSCSGGTNDVCDSTTSALDGVFVSGTPPTWQTEDKCVSGKCLFFAGTGDASYSTVKLTSMGNLASQTSGAISLWARVNSINSQGVLYGLTRGSDTNDTSLKMFYDNRTSGGSNFEVKLVLDNTTQWDFTVSSTDFNSINENNKWHHFMLTHNATTPAMYIDGKAVTANFTVSTNKTKWLKALLTDATNKSDRLELMQFEANGTGFSPSKGFVDEFKIFPNTFTTAQVAASYSSKGTNEGISARFGQADNAFLNDGLVAYWPMNETSGNPADSSGNGTTLTNNATATYTVGKFGNAGTMVAASSQYFSVNTPASLQLDKFTYSTWVNVTSFPGLNTSLMKRGSLPGVQASMFLNLTSTQLRTVISTDGTTSNLDVSVNHNLSTATWAQVTWTYDGTSSVLYVNSVPISTTAFTGTQFAPTGGNDVFNLGAIINSTFDGKMDDVRVYNRGLSQKEVLALYNWAPGPVGYWKMDEKSGTNAFDSSGNGNTGTLNSGVAWDNGKFGGTSSMDGNDDYVDMGTNTILQPKNISLELWYYFQTGGEAFGGLIDKSANNWTTESYLLDSFSVNTDCTGNTDTDFVTFTIYTAACHGLTSGSALTNNAWHHIAATYDGATMKLYINGTLSSSLTTSGDITYSTARNFQVGALNSTLNQIGKYDDVKVYNYARTAQQVVEDMNGGHPSGGSPVASQVIHYRMDEQNGTTLNNYNTAQPTLTSTTTGGPTWRGKELCKTNGCLDFDGTDDVATTTNANPIDFDIGLVSGVTFSAWVNPDTVGEGSAGEIFRKSSTTFCRVGGSTPFNISCSLDLGTDATLTVNSQIPGTSWTHVAMTWTDDADDEITIYINGKAVGTSTNGVGPVSADSSNLLIAGGTSNNWDGKIDEFKVYASELTADQMKIENNFGSSENFGVGTDEANLITGGAGNAPVGYWNLNDNTGTTAKNTSGTGDGTFGGGSNAPSWSTGKYSSSLAFNDAHWLQIADSASWDGAGTGNFTVEAWIRRTGNNQFSSPMEALSKRNSEGGGATGWVLLLEGTDSTDCALASNSGDDKVCFKISDGSSVYTVKTNAAQITNDKLWHHVAVVVDRATAANFNIFIDGVKVAQTKGGTLGSVVNIDNAHALCIGEMTAGSCADSANGFIGNIDEVKIYNYARTDAQVAYDFNRGGPKAWWRLDENIGTTSNDSSGNSFTGTLTGTPTWAQGKLNTGLTLNGSSQYSTVSDNFALRFDASTESFSTFAWVKRAATGSEMDIVSKEDADNDGWRIEFTSADKIRCSVNSTDVDSSNTIADTTIWHLVGCTMDRNGNGQVYIDGKADGTATSISGVTMATTAGLRIGALSYTTITNYFNGTIDDIRIFNYPLSASQVKKLYNGDSTARFGPTTGTP